MSCRIGKIVYSLFKDKYPEKREQRLDPKTRMALHKELFNLINTTSIPEIQLNPGIYNENGTPAVPPVKYEDEYKFFL